MIINKEWMTDQLTEEELMMFYNIASLDSQYTNFDLDTLQAVRPPIFARNMNTIREKLTEEGIVVLDSLKAKLIDFEGSFRL